jgi:hypothetical protein
VTIAGGVRGLFGLAGAAGAAGANGNPGGAIIPTVGWPGGAGGPLFHALGRQARGAVANVALPPIDNVEATPFMLSRNATIDTISARVNVAAAAGGKGRIGIYASTAATLYPGALVLDAGEVATDAIGQKDLAVGLALTGGVLYWVAVTVGISAGPPTWSGIPAQDLFAAMFGQGTGNFDFNPNTKLRVARAYAALPANFPAGAALVSGAFVGVHVRFSA